ncbi:hypothetical protein BDF22DRAFT_251890 [Syncephalis plumigaleata]|nr:hypothetical protein BDF22DRAFT_251890 [Syncephalis plumigaleata]
MIKMESAVESGTNDNTAAPITTSAETMVASRSFTSVEGPLIPFELIQRGNRRACNPVTQAEVDQVYSGIDHVTNLADMDSSHSQPIAARGWIALIERGGCGFIDKIRHAQAVGASAVIVGDHEGIGLIAMIADVDASDVKIPAVFLRRRCYRDLLHHATAKATFITVKITGDTFSSWFTYDSFLGTWLLYSVLFYIVLSILWATWHIIFGPIRLPVIQGTFTIRFSSSRSASTNTIGARVPAASPAASPAEHARRTLRQLRVDLHAMWRRLDGWRAAEEQVRQIPMVTFSTTEAESITDFPRRCAICLEDFIDGDRLRLLPCRHRFHANCVDRWLITRRRLCPICKQDITIARVGNHNTTSASASASPSSTVVNHDNDNASSSHSPIASTNEEIEHASTSNDTNNQDQDEIALNDGSSNNDNNHRRTVSEATPRPNYWAN